MKRSQVHLCLILLALVSWPLSIQAQYPYWKYDRLIEANAGHEAGQPSVAVSGTKAVAVWVQEYGGVPRAFSNYSTNGGATWHTPKLIEDNAGNMVWEAKVALSGSTAVAVWTQDVGLDVKVHTNYSTDGGATWHADRVIEYPAGSNSNGLQLAVSGTRVLLVYYRQDSNLHFHTFFNASQDGGKTWRDYPTQIETTTSYDSDFPFGAVSGSNIAVVWTRSDGTNTRIFYNASANGGLNWHGYATLDNNAGYDADRPKVALSGTRAVAVWEQMLSGIWRVYSSYSTDGGQTWQADKLIADLGAVAQNNPQVVITGSTAIAVWRQATLTGPANIYSCFSTDGGASWSTARPIETSTLYSSFIPQLALSGSGLASLWTRSDGTMNRVFANYSPNKGVTWRSERMIDGLAGTDGNTPQVALSGSAIVAAWRVSDGSNSRVAANNATFTASPKDKLKPPVLHSPPNGADGLTTTVAMTWKDTNSLPQELKLKLRLKPAGGLYKYFTVPAGNTSYVISGLISGKTYSWNIQAIGNGTSILNSAWANGGVDWKFTIQ